MANQRQFVRGPRMPKHWHSIPSISLAFTSSSTLQGGSLALDGPWTVIRMLGSYLIAPTAGGTFVAGDAADIVVGIGVVSSDAFAAGAGSMPDPAGEPEYPWLYWKDTQFSLLGAPAGDEALSTARVEFDIRSMRKIKPRESLAVVAQYADRSGNPPYTVRFGRTRVLVAT